MKLISLPKQTTHKKTDDDKDRTHGIYLKTPGEDAKKQEPKKYMKNE